MVSLDFSSNELANCSPEKLANMLAKLPKSVACLDLGLNNLGKLSDGELNEILRAIPKTVKVLSLRGNTLGDRSIEKLTEAFALLHKDLVYLDLSENTFSADSQAQLVEIFHTSTKVSFVSRDAALKEVYESILSEKQIDAASVSPTTTDGDESDALPESEAEKPQELFVRTQPGDAKEKDQSNDSHPLSKVAGRYRSFTAQLKRQGPDDLDEKAAATRRKSIG